ncbi:TonB-dependent receptor [Campylobacter sp. RM16190]|uniref:TonB-dependent receptor domain-containing protein n=1 Tax=Campylobacter sp. RM16190 TaxID=1705727 RepID=UPI0014748639|nr:TonB-dependent receptor [Campylobacter sp. RM16190]
MLKIKKTAAAFACIASSSYLLGAELIQLDQVVVTAGGFEQDIKEAPASVSVIDNKKLSQGVFKSLHNIANKTPGVSMVGGEDGPASGISIRGMESSQTLILIDGKRVSSSAANPKGGAGDMNSNFIPPVDAIERVEIIRGPMSSLYGSDAVGGVINIITKKSANKFSGSVGFSYLLQNHDGIGDHRQMDFYLNAPILDDKLAVQLWGYKKLRDEDEYKGGYQRSDKKSLSAKIWITPDEHNKFYLLGSKDMHDYSRTVGKTATLKTNKLINNYDYDRYSYGLGYVGDFNILNADISYIYDQTQRTSLFDSLAPATVKNNNFNSKFSTFLDSHTLTFGYDFSKQAVETTFIVSNALKSGLKNPAEYSMKEHALFLEDEWEILMDSLYLTFGGRWTHNQYFGSHFSPRIYAVYNINDNWTIKGGVATGYKSPNINQISPEVGTIQGGWRIVDFGNKDLKPEKSTTYEIATHYDNGSDFRANVTLFKNEFKNKILDTDGSNLNKIPAYEGCTGAPHVKCPGWGTYFNIDGADVWGIELGGDYDINQKLNLSASYTYNNSKIKTGNPIISTPKGDVSFDQTTLSRLDGKSLTATPQHKANMIITYEPINKVSTFIGANYESELTSVKFGPGNKVSENNKKLFTADIGVNWSINDNLSLNFTAYNIFDNVRYDEGLADDGNYYWYPEEGRRFLFKINAKW